MKRGMSGKTRRGSPPLRRQRGALRVVQLTLLGIAVAMVFMARSAWVRHEHPLPAASTLGTTDATGLGEVFVLGAGALAFAALAFAMGLGVVRGPDPHLMD